MRTMKMPPEGRLPAEAPRLRSSFEYIRLTFGPVAGCIIAAKYDVQAIIVRACF